MPRTLFTPPLLFIGIYHPDDTGVPLRTADVLPEVTAAYLAVGTTRSHLQTDRSFDFSQAPNAGGFFLGDYVGLTSENTHFLSVFGQSFLGDPGSVFFRRVGP